MNAQSHFAENDPRVWMYGGAMLAVVGLVMLMYGIQAIKRKAEMLTFVVVAYAIALMMIDYIMVFIALIVYSNKGTCLDF